MTHLTRMVRPAGVPRSNFLTPKRHLVVKLPPVAPSTQGIKEMYGPLFISRLPGLSRSATPCLHRPPAHYEGESDLPIRFQGFMAELNAALRVAIPPIARYWMLDTEARYGMVVSNIHPLVYRDGREHWLSITSSPLVTVVFEPGRDRQVKITPLGTTPKEQADAEYVADSLRKAFSQSGKSSVDERTSPCLTSGE